MINFAECLTSQRQTACLTSQRHGTGLLLRGRPSTHAMFFFPYWSKVCWTSWGNSFQTYVFIFLFFCYVYFFTTLHPPDVHSIMLWMVVLVDKLINHISTWGLPLSFCIPAWGTQNIDFWSWRQSTALHSLKTSSWSMNKFMSKHIQSDAFCY